MKALKSTIAGILLLGAACASGSALAYYGGHHGGYYGGHSGARVGVYIGAPALGFGYPYYGYPGYAYGGYGFYGPSTTIVTTPAAPPVYVEQSSAAFSGGPANDGNWYYCHNPDGYYPYVKECAGGWQRVPAQPAPSAQPAPR